MKNILAVDFGSTFTKVTAIDMAERKILGTNRAFTTINTDINIGLEKAKENLFAEIGKIEFEETIACSSAAGGLKMISVGLVPSLTSKASSLAATSAGAKVIKTYSYEISEKEKSEISAYAPDIVLLCGGTDGGNSNVILANAKSIAEIEGNFSVIVAGNKSAAKEAADILKQSKNVLITDNVMPEFEKLNIKPAQDAIRELFIKRIIKAKGIDSIQQKINFEIIPTPLSVLEGAYLLSKGTGHKKGFGEFMLVDVGGATTDVYSMADGFAQKPNTMIKGIRSPYAKRTVEGDLGVRFNLKSILENESIINMSNRLQTSEERISEFMNICEKTPEFVPESGSDFKKIDEELCKICINVGFTRHCGKIESVYTPFGETFLQEGKDLTHIKNIIGVGGPIANAERPEKLITRNLDYTSLKPHDPELIVDRNYIFYALGLLSRIDPDIALEIMFKEILAH